MVCVLLSGPVPCPPLQPNLQTQQLLKAVVLLSAPELQNTYNPPGWFDRCVSGMRLDMNFFFLKPSVWSPQHHIKLHIVAHPRNPRS